MNIEVNSERWVSLEELPGEEWRIVEDTPENGTYLVSNYGRIKRLAFSGGRYRYPDMIFKVHQNRENGYYKVRIGKSMYYVHRLVAMAFIPPKPGCRYVDHRNGNIHDNRARNLRWVTAKQNAGNPITKWEREKRFGVTSVERPEPIRTQVNLNKYNPTICLSRGEYPLSKKRGA